MTALGGIIIAAMGVELNDAVTAAILPTIGGGLGFSHDPSTWLSSSYASAEILGMAISPWFFVTFSLRRWALFVIGLTCVSTVLTPVFSNLTLLLILRTIQGLCEGLTIPMLMTTALRVLQPAIRLYGLAVYSLSATFFPSLAAAAAALWIGTGDSPLGWQFSFYEIVPLSAISAVMIWWGMPQDPPRYERFKEFNWRGVLLIILGFGALSTMLMQGDRLDWFNSPLICVLGVVSVVCLPLLAINEWHAKIPLLKLQLLGRRNIAFGLITLFTFVVVTNAGSTLPDDYLQEVQGFLPAQLYLITAEIAATQLVFLPLMALVLDFEWVDARAVNFLGLGLVVGATIANSYVTAVWMLPQFLLWQAVTSLGEAMVVMSLLMITTNSVDPPNAPFASALVNTPRAVAEVVGVWLVQLIARWRGGLHSSRLTDQAGQGRYGVEQAHSSGLAQSIMRQTEVLTLSDGFLVMAAIAAALMVVVVVLPKHSPPPRIALASR